MIKHTTYPQPLRAERQPYDPNLHNRRCPACGERSGWRRSLALGGTWTHCGPEWIEDEHVGRHHACGPACVLGGVA